MDMRRQFVVITPRPGKESFHPVLISSLFSRTAPTHVWVNVAQEQPCFMMLSADFQNWAKYDIHIGLLFPSEVNIVIDDSHEINEVMAKAMEVAAQRSTVTG